MKEFAQPLIVPIAEDLYRLVETYSYEWDNAGIRNRLTIPAGFEFDGASAPRIIWTLTGIIPDGLIRAAALVHDFIYRHGGRLPAGVHQVLVNGEWVDARGRWTRGQADKMFARLMREAGYSKTRRRAAYLGVRLFGWASWKGKTNAELATVS